MSRRPLPASPPAVALPPLTVTLATPPDLQVASVEIPDQVIEALRRGNKNVSAGDMLSTTFEEYQQQSERKTYLDGQYADLTEALETLENAIRKIDKETRSRFKETFDKATQGLGRLFPRLFGGGHAYLRFLRLPFRGLRSVQRHRALVRSPRRRHGPFHAVTELGRSQ